MAAEIPFVRELEFEYGAVAQVTPLIRRVIARNPSPFTFHGTGTYIIGRDNVAIVDPGPDDPVHVDALLDAVAGEHVTHILVTHTHRDHSPAARHVQAATRAPTYGFGPHGTRRAGPQVEEGADYGFMPDVRLRDGDLIEGSGWTVEAVHTPGHTSNHICFSLAEENILLSGDHVMGWSTTVISPPDGDMRAYLSSLAKLLGREEAVFWPTHGGAIREPSKFVKALIRHREGRERQITECLRTGVVTIPNMVERMYADVPPVLHPAAGQSVLAHLIHMIETGRVRAAGDPDIDSQYSLLD